MVSDIEVTFDKFTFEKTVDELKDEFRAVYGDTIADEVLPDLEGNNWLEWFDVVYENRDKIPDLDSGSGTKEFDLVDLLNQGDLFKILAESERVDWNDPSRFSLVLYYSIAQAIDDNFATDAEFLTYLREETAMDDEQIETLSKISESDTNRFLGFSDEFDLEIAKEYAVIANYNNVGIVSRWDDQPSVGQYIVYNVTKDGYDKTGKIVLEVVGVETDEIMLSDIAKDFSGDEKEDIILETVDSLVVQSVSYEDTVLDLYEGHYLIGEGDETSILESNEEKFFEGVYDENPVPLTE